MTRTTHLSDEPYLSIQLKKEKFIDEVLRDIRTMDQEVFKKRYRYTFLLCITIYSFPFILMAVVAIVRNVIGI